MIQRIQTIFLLLAISTVAFLYFIPVYQIIPANKQLTYAFYNGIMQFFPTKVKIIASGLPFIILLSASLLFAFVSIFMYKRRPLQIRLGQFNIVLLLSVSIIYAWYAYNFCSKFAGAFSVKAGAFMPLLAIVFLLLANRFIKKDEKLIKSLDRIR